MENKLEDFEILNIPKLILADVFYGPYYRSALALAYFEKEIATTNLHRLFPFLPSGTYPPNIPKVVGPGYYLVSVGLKVPDKIGRSDYSHISSFEDEKTLKEICYSQFSSSLMTTSVAINCNWLTSVSRRIKPFLKRTSQCAPDLTKNSE
jgi:hypothetical protein